MRALRYVVFAGCLLSAAFAYFELRRALRLADGLKDGEVTPQQLVMGLIPLRSAQWGGPPARKAGSGRGVLVDKYGHRYEVNPPK